MTTASLTLRIDSGVKKRLEREDKSLDRSTSYLAAKAIEAFVEAREEKRRAIEAAIIEADKGVFISSKAMHKWMDSWGTDNELPPPKPDIFPETP